MTTTIKVLKAFRAVEEFSDLLVLANGAAVLLHPDTCDQIFESEDAAGRFLAESQVEIEGAPGLLAAWVEGYSLGSEKAEIVAPHGGRRHGLNDKGRAQRVNLVLDDAAVIALSQLAAEHQLTRSEVVRRLITGVPLGP